MKKKAAPMPKVTSKTKTAPLYKRIREILESARSSVARSVNTTQVVANWLVGREIVDEEQRGKRRASYGAQLLTDLSARLRDEFGQGYSVDNLEMFRRFYLEYADLISDAVRRISPGGRISDTLRRKSLARSSGELAIRRAPQRGRAVKAKSYASGGAEFEVRSSEFGVRSSELGVRRSGFGVRSSGFGVRGAGILAVLVGEKCEQSSRSDRRNRPIHRGVWPSWFHSCEAPR